MMHSTGLPQARELTHDQLGKVLVDHIGRGLEERHLQGFVDRLYVDLFRKHAMSIEDLERVRPLSRVRRTILANAVRIEPLLELERSILSKYDGTRRMVFRIRRTTGDDATGARNESARIEAVAIPRRDDLTLCISSQSGCALACSFCAPGLLGVRDNLTTAEILEQHAWAERETNKRVTDIVFMGMGEPLMNYDAVLEAAHRFTETACAQISYKKLVISTAGVVPQIHRYARERQPFPLYFSITSAISEKRRELMPIENTYPLPELVDAIRAYLRSRRWNKRATLEYVAIPGENMGEEDVRAIGETFGSLPIILNVIPYNATDGRYRPPTWSEVKAFTTRLRDLKIPVKVRFSGAKTERGGCGQLTADLVAGAPLEGHHLAPPGIFTDLGNSSN